MAPKKQLNLSDYFTPNTKVTILEYRGKGKQVAEYERRKKKTYSSNRAKALKETGHGPNVQRDQALNRCPLCKKHGTSCTCEKG